MKTLYFIAILLISAILYSCTKEDRLDHIDSEAPAPGQVSNVKIKINPGGATLTYQAPSDPNFSYAKAVYEIQPGVYREAKASLYADALELVGFGDTLTHEVQIYSVGKNEKASAPFSVTVKPLEPPVLSVFETINMQATFGGVQIGFKNDPLAKLAIEVMVDTTGQNTWSPVTTFFTGAAEGTFSVRGFDTLQRKFAVYIRDRWNNKSDTLIEQLSPILEVVIPKPWTHVQLPTDTYTPAEPQFTVDKLWDNIIAGYQGMYASSHGSPMPQWFTIDLRKRVSISRIREHHIEPGLYGGGTVKKFELWGSNNPDADGGWNNWVLLGTFESFKPSGLPMGQNAPEDVNYGWFLGEEFSFNTLLPPVRYIRWKTLETYSSDGQVSMSELDIYGQISQ